MDGNGQSLLSVFRLHCLSAVSQFPTQSVFESIVLGKEVSIAFRLLVSSRQMTLTQHPVGCHQVSIAFRLLVSSRLGVSVVKNWL